MMTENGEARAGSGGGNVDNERSDKFYGIALLGRIGRGFGSLSS
jgi:hypothetical protein